MALWGERERVATMQNEYLFACTVSQILMSPANAAHPMLHD